MAVWHEKMGLFARSPDARPLPEIAADIDEELAFHVEESARALTEEGLDADSARAEALRRFGDYGRIRRECARTQMGERVMLQRIQLVLTAVLILAVVVLVWSNHETRAAMQAERAQSVALLSRIEARIGGDEASRSEMPTMPSDTSVSADERMRIDRADPEALPPGEYLTAYGQQTSLAVAQDTWIATFQQQESNWRHGLRVAERLAALPGIQGVELLARVWPNLSVEHREQVMKPFVFDGGSPYALEVLKLGFDDAQSSVKERAVLYLYSYAWKDLWRGETTGETWFAEYHERPIAEVLTANAGRWARELGELVRNYSSLPEAEASNLLGVVSKVDVRVFSKAGVDLAAILQQNGVGELSTAQLKLLDANSRSAAERVISWCQK